MMGNYFAQPQSKPLNVFCLDKHQPCGPCHDSLGREKFDTYLTYYEHDHVIYTCNCHHPGVIVAGVWEDQDIRIAAASVIQAYWRGYWVRKKLRDRNRACFVAQGTARSQGPRVKIALQDQGSSVTGIRSKCHRSRIRLIPTDASMGCCGRSDNRGCKTPADASLDGKAADIIQAHYRDYRDRQASCHTHNSQNISIPSTYRILHDNFTQTKPSPVAELCNHGPKQFPWGFRRKNVCCQTSAPEQIATNTKKWGKLPTDKPLVVPINIAEGKSATKNQWDKVSKDQVLEGVGRAPTTNNREETSPEEPVYCKSILKKHLTSHSRDRIHPGGGIMSCSPSILKPKKVVTFNIALPLDGTNDQLRGMKNKDYD